MPITIKLCMGYLPVASLPLLVLSMQYIQFSYRFNISLVDLKYQMSLQLQIMKVTSIKLHVRRTNCLQLSIHITAVLIRVAITPMTTMAAMLQHSHPPGSSLLKKLSNDLHTLTAWLSQVKLKVVCGRRTKAENPSTAKVHTDQGP